MGCKKYGIDVCIQNNLERIGMKKDGGEYMTKKKDDDVKITHHFLDGSVSDTLEGHVIPEDIQIEIFKILLAGQKRRNANSNTK